MQQCVLSEPSNDPELDGLYAECVAFAPFEGFVEAAQALLQDTDRQQYARPGSWPHIQSSLLYTWALNVVCGLYGSMV